MRGVLGSSSCILRFKESCCVGVNGKDKHSKLGESSVMPDKGPII